MVEHHLWSPSPTATSGNCACLMFTGLVEGQGRITNISSDGPSIDLTISPPSDMAFDSDGSPGARIGDSVAINGCCLTIVRIDDGWTFQAGEETLSKTSLGGVTIGDHVNLERSMPVNGRLGGHFVQGHVDGTGIVDDIQQDGEWTTMWFRVPLSLTQQMVGKGSVTVDGISLTLVDVEPARFSVALIPHTLEVTTLGQRQVGDRVNIETDILGKYVLKMMTEAGRG